MYKIIFSPASQHDLKKLPKNIQKQIIKKIEFYTSQNNPLSFAKPLSNFLPSTHRFRAGDYRVAFSIENKTIIFHKIRHRREIYKRN